MEYFFLSVYDYLNKHRPLCYLSLAALLVFFTFSTLQIHIEEDVTKFLSGDKEAEMLNQVFQNSKFRERLVVMVSMKDSSDNAAPDSLIMYSDELVGAIETQLKPFVSKINYKVDDEVALEMFNILYDHLPVFLEEEDYAAIDSMITPGAVRNKLEHNYHQLISPTGLVMKKMMMKDPVGISALAMKKLKGLQYDDNFELYDNCLLTKDHNHLVLFISLINSPYETGSNKKFLENLSVIIEQTSAKHNGVKALYYGATAVAVGNATQLRRDTIFTTTLLIVLLIIFLVWFFKRKRAPVIILIPVLFGALFSLTCVYWIKGSVSVIALAAGSVVLGIAVNYSLHFITHLRHTQNVRETVRDLAKPMTIGSTTTVLAFFCLQFTNAQILRDLGLFAGFSLIGAALCSLIFLPHIVNPNLFSHSAQDSGNWLDKFSLNRPGWNKYAVLAIFIITPFLFHYAFNVKFNSDMNRLNFVSRDLQQAEKEINKISEFSLHSIYILASGRNLEEALRNNERISSQIDKLKQEGLLKKSFSVSALIISDSLQQVKIDRWNNYWTSEKKENLTRMLHAEGQQLKFTPAAFSAFASLLNKHHLPADKELVQIIRSAFFDDYITETPDEVTVVTLAKADANKRDTLLLRFNDGGELHAVDRQMLTSIFVKEVNSDFTFIVTFTSLLVFIVLLISYGRIELTLITFIPMLIAWIWILGIMALLNIEFNIINVMISTFIFGLGDDYSIFIMDGLQQEYKLGRKNLPSIRTAISLSAITTIGGLGVLILAQHPALKSIAAISIIGIVCVFVISQTLEPFLFSLFITKRTKNGLPPVTFTGMCKSVFAFIFFIVGSILLTIIGFILIKLIPFKRRQMRHAYHILISGYTRTFVHLMTNVKKRIVNQDKVSFKTPQVIISNHQSFIDILVTIMLNPKIILLTKKWVWNSPIFGGVVRMADYYPVMEGVDENLDRLNKRVKEGYSIMVFPEGSRSLDGTIRRFHRGAFYIAEQLKLDILPLLIHGTGNAIRKGDFYLNDTTITLKFLPPIHHDDKTFGETYSERTKMVSRYFRQEFKILSEEVETPDFYPNKLISNFLYKGPVLEWYLWIKLKLEKNYEPIEKLIPKQATILDLGCGYGFLCYMLHFMSKDRLITGVDYDEDKIETANHCYSKSDQVQFVCADITSYPVAVSDVIILNDVLHYLEPNQQLALLEQSITALNPGGRLIVREGNSDLKKRHQGTRLTEFMSVKLFKFNRSAHDLHFMSAETVKQLADKYDMETEVIDDSKLTSNIIIVLKKKQTEYAAT